MAKNPKVFISYSHDSPEHKQWVSELAAQLRHNGIDAMIDQWDLGLGDDVTRFMERGIVDADRVLVICTEEYVNRANAAEGGVGYERMIVNAELVQNLGTDKFIPIIRQASEKEKMPTFLGTRVYAVFTSLTDGGSVFFPEGQGSLPGLSGILNPNRDIYDRTSLYASNISINEGQPQPVHCVPGDDLRLTDANGRELLVRIVAIVGKSALLEYRAYTKRDENDN